MSQELHRNALGTVSSGIGQDVGRSTGLVLAHAVHKLLGQDSATMCRHQPI